MSLIAFFIFVIVACTATYWIIIRDIYDDMKKCDECGHYKEYHHTNMPAGQKDCYEILNARKALNEFYFTQEKTVRCSCPEYMGR